MHEEIEQFVSDVFDQEDGSVPLKTYVDKEGDLNISQMIMDESVLDGLRFREVFFALFRTYPSKRAASVFSLFWQENRLHMSFQQAIFSFLRKNVPIFGLMQKSLEQVEQILVSIAASLASKDARKAHREYDHWRPAGRPAGRPPVKAATTGAGLAGRSGGLMRTASGH